MSMISIIIPAYNAEKYIGTCVESILRQEYEDYEIIIVDDGSQDDTFSICTQLLQKSKKIRLLHQNNKGVSAARNAGLKTAGGQYIMFVDADDSVGEHFLREMSAAITEDETIDMVIGGFYEKSAAGARAILPFETSRCLETKSIGSFFEELYGKHIFNAPFAKVYKREKMKGLWFDEHVRIGEDFLLNAEFLTRCSRVFFCANAGYIYHTDNMLSATKRYQPGDFDCQIRLYYAGRELQQLLGVEKKDGDAVDRTLCRNGIGCLQMIFYEKAPVRQKQTRCREILCKKEFEKSCSYSYGFPLRDAIPQQLCKHKNIPGMLLFWKLKQCMSLVLRRVPLHRGAKEG